EGECEKLIIGHTPQSRLNLRQGAPADVQPVELTLRGKFLLSKPNLVSPLSDLRSNDICWGFGSGHQLNKSVLNVSEERPRKCYAFLAIKYLVFERSFENQTQKRH